MRAALALLVALAAPAAATTPPCEAEVRVEPSRAWVGQQLVYRLRILRRADVTSVRFTDDLSFPSFRVEWLPGQTLDPAIHDVGASRLVVEERRALFPVRAGTLAIPPARIECAVGAERFEAAVPGTTLDVREAPAPGVVGRVTANARLARRRIALGEAVTLTVQLRGEANLWDVPPPLEALPAIDVHAREPETARVTGPRLVLERSFVYDLVPRRAGAHDLPPLRVAWVDPETGGAQVAETAALRLEVLEPVASAAGAEPSERRASAPVSRAPFAILAAIVAAAGLLVGSWRVRRSASPARAATDALAAADAAAARGDRAAERDALASALREALATRDPAARSLAPEELVARSDGAARDAALALADLDRARFAAGGSDAPRLDAERVRALLRAL